MDFGAGIRNTFAMAGLVVHRRSPANSPGLRRAQLLESLGIAIVLDVGANVGVYGREVRGHGYQGRIVSFEPLSTAYSQLAKRARTDSAWEVRRVALSDEDGEAEINISASDPWSSLLPTDEQAGEPERLASIGTETVQIARLDSLGIEGRCWLKLDVQGFELHALRGAEKSLASVQAIECEVSLEPFYIGQPTMRQMVDYLDDRGFTPATVSNGWMRPSGRARWVDMVFTKSSH
jgi:FkbM family methyltransferase